MRHLAAEAALGAAAADLSGHLDPYLKGTWMSEEFRSAGQYARDERADPSLAEGVDPCPYCGARWGAHGR